MKHYKESNIIRTLRIWNNKFWNFIEDKLCTYIGDSFEKIYEHICKWDKYWDEFFSGSLDPLEFMRRKLKIMEVIMVILLLVQFGMGLVLLVK